LADCVGLVQQQHIRNLNLLQQQLGYVPEASRQTGLTAQAAAAAAAVVTSCATEVLRHM
jgi:hypothetical protein